MSYYYYSNGNQSYIDLKYMILNGTTQSTNTNEGSYPNFPGSNTSPGNEELITSNNAINKGISSGFYYYETGVPKDVLSNRLPPFENFTNTNILTKQMYYGVTGIRILIIGASGSGGGGGGANAVNYYGGGGGGSGGQYNAYLTNLINLSALGLKTPLSNYEYQVGTGGPATGNGGSSTAGAVSGGNDGTDGTATYIKLIATTNAQYIITVNGGKKGYGGVRGGGSQVGNGGANGLDGTISLTTSGIDAVTSFTGDFTTNNYITNTWDTNNIVSGSKNTALAGNSGASNTTTAPGGYRKTTRNISNLGTGYIYSTNFTPYYNYSNNDSYGGYGGAPKTSTNGQAGGAGVNGFIRVYYFYN